MRKKWNGQLKVWGKHICTIVRGIEQSDYLGNFFRKEISSLVLLKSRKFRIRLRLENGGMDENVTRKKMLLFVWSLV